ncbi:MAG: putative glycoside hydrolase [Elusimicrobiota bacterium]
MLIKALCLLIFAQPLSAQSPSTAPAALQPSATAQAPSEADVYGPLLAAPGQVRGIHLSSWGSGSAKLRRQTLARINDSVINAVAIALKETDGKIYIPGVPSAAKYGAYAPAISRPEEMMADFREAGLYTIARIVVFKDKVLPKARPDLAVRTPSGELWRANNGATWTDPYSREVWDYNLEVAKRAVELGFDEIQFDYIRYPTEGNTSLCRYSKPHSPKNGVDNLAAFLAYARKRLPAGVKISAAIFGLTTSSKDDMGIGQSIHSLAENTDFIYPMMYPSHYNPGEYRLKNPDAEPFKVIDRGLRDARRRLPFADYAKIRPYLQDFTLRHKYGPQEVRAQLIASRRNYLPSWILWNASNRYNWAALTPQSYRSFVDPAYEHEPSPAPKP